MKPSSGYSDELVMAYADGELDAATTAAIEQDMEHDASLAQRVAQQRALREDVFAAFRPVLDEAVPARLADAVAEVPDQRVNVSDLAAARDAKAKRQHWTWREWGGIAASLVIGVMAGRSGMAPAGDSGVPQQSAALNSSASASVISAGPLLSRDGQLVAQGTLTQALTTQLASTQDPSAPVKIGVSFRSGSGEYCRSFTLTETQAKAPQAMAGLACSRGQDGDSRWRIAVIAQTGVQTGEFRQADSGIPAAVAAVMDATIQGAPLDAEAERAAAQSHWKP